MGTLNQLEIFDRAVEVFRAQSDRPNFSSASKKLRAMGLRSDRRTLTVWWERGRTLSKTKRTPSIEKLLEMPSPPANDAAPVLAGNDPVTSSATEPSGTVSSATSLHAEPSGAVTGNQESAGRSLGSLEAVADAPETRLLKLRQEAIDAVAAESRVLRAGRHLSEGIMATATSVLSGLHPVAAKLREHLVREASLPGHHHDVDATLRRLGSLTKTLLDAAQATERLVAAQRLLAGAATSIVEHRATQPQPPPGEDPAMAAARARAILAAVADAHRTIDVEGRTVPNVDLEQEIA